MLNEVDQKYYRAELKYICGEALLLELEQRLKPLMKADAHGDVDNCYSVHSLYFDDYRDSCYFDNDIGTNRRYKYRIRYYNDDAEHLRLEQKEKRNGLCHKNACPITREQYFQLCDRYGMEAFWESNDTLLRRFCIDKAKKLFTPKVIVSYERRAYVLYDGNIRITFDRNISVSDEIDRFLAGDFQRRPVHPKGTHLLEIKYDNYLPEYVKAALPAMGFVQTAFSKYNAGRRTMNAMRRKI